MDWCAETKTHPLYEKVKVYINEHPLPYQELSTRDIVESRTLFRKISTFIGGEEKMEQLNLLIHQRFMFVPDTTAFLQGLTDDMLYALTHRDIETEKTVLQLWD